MPYELIFEPGWDRFYEKMDNAIKKIIWKKIQKQKQETPARHMLHGLSFYVLEVGQYRIAIRILEEQKGKAIIFVGNHKQYEKWYKEQEKISQ